MNKQYYNSNFAGSSFFHNTTAFVLGEIEGLMSTCYGPYGSHVMIANKFGAEAMKDGLGILTSYIPSSSISKTIHQTILNVANKQAEEVGDGTTTTILLLCYLYKTFRKIMTENKISPSKFNGVVKDAVDIIKENMSSRALVGSAGNIDWAGVRDAVYTSVDGNKDLTDIIIELYKEIGSKDPLIMVETSPTSETKYELVKGLELSGSPVASDVFFGGYSRKNVTAPKIVLINGIFKPAVEYIMDLDNECMRTNEDYVFLFSGIDDDVLNQLISMKKMNPSLLNHIVLFQITMSGLNDEFMDTAAMLGTSPIDSDTITRVPSYQGFMNVISKSAGSSDMGNFTEFSARFNDPKSDETRLNERIEMITKMIDEYKASGVVGGDIITNLEGRKSMMSKNYAKLYIGGPSPQRKNIDCELAKDGVLQAASCIKHGVVDGCNTAVPNAIIHYFKKKLDYDRVMIINTLNHRCDTGVVDEVLVGIYDAYLEAYVTLLTNKNNDSNLSSLYLSEMEDKLDFTTMNIREDDDTPVINSAATDYCILDNSVDMALLLATTQAYLSTTPEFDPLNNNLKTDQ